MVGNWPRLQDTCVVLLKGLIKTSSQESIISVIIMLRGCADKSLARPTSRCRRTEQIVLLEKGVCSCTELQVFSY